MYVFFSFPDPIVKMEDENDMAPTIIPCVPPLILDINDDENSHDSDLISIPIEDTDEEDDLLNEQHDENLHKKRSPPPLVPFSVAALKEEKNDEDDDFDSQKTVIYSEILQHKDQIDNNAVEEEENPSRSDESIDFHELQAELDALNRLEDEVFKGMEACGVSQSVVDGYNLDFMHHGDDNDDVDMSHLIEDVRETERIKNESIFEQNTEVFLPTVDMLNPSFEEEEKDQTTTTLSNDITDQATQLFDPNDVIDQPRELQNEHDMQTGMNQSIDQIINEALNQETQLFVTPTPDIPSNINENNKIINNPSNDDVLSNQKNEDEEINKEHVSNEELNASIESIKIKEELPLQIDDEISFTTPQNRDIDSDDDLSSIFMDHSYLSLDQETDIKSNQKTWRLSQSVNEPEVVDENEPAAEPKETVAEPTEPAVDTTAASQEMSDSQIENESYSDRFDINRWLDFIEKKVDGTSSEDLEIQIKFVKDMTQFMCESQSYDIVEFLEKVDNRIESIREKIRDKSKKHDQESVPSNQSALNNINEKSNDDDNDDDSQKSACDDLKTIENSNDQILVS